MADLPDGIPPLLGDITGLFLTPDALLTDDTYSGYGQGQPPTWGVFDQSGAPVVIAETVTTMSYKQDWAIADYPVERGGFESYDKVNTPFAVQMQFVSGGTEERRQQLLDSVVAIADQLTLYDVVTPEAVYPSVNVQRYEYKRAANNGLGLMTVNVTFLEIREEGVSDFQNSKSPSGFTAQQSGNVQSPDASTDVSAAVQGQGVN